MLSKTFQKKKKAIQEKIQDWKVMIYFVYI